MTIIEPVPLINALTKQEEVIHSGVECVIIIEDGEVFLKTNFGKYKLSREAILNNRKYFSN
jgi:hypothetical protein